MEKQNELANQIGGLRLAIMAIEYMVAVQKDQVDEVVKIICSEFGADEKGVMSFLQSLLNGLKVEEQSLRMSDDPDGMIHALNQMVENGYMTKIGEGYKLTVLGEVYAKHQITNDPLSREFYKRLLLAHGNDPAEDELLGQ